MEIKNISVSPGDTVDLKKVVGMNLSQAKMDVYLKKFRQQATNRFFYKNNKIKNLPRDKRKNLCKKLVWNIW